MNNRAIFAIVFGLAFVASLAGGFYYAWQNGVIPVSIIKPHPRAPVPENFLATLKASPTVMQSLRPACVRVNLYSGRSVDRMGRPGLVHQRVPGWDVMVIAQVPGESGQRIGNLTQVLDALVKAGIYTTSDTETDDGTGGKLPARAYALTFAGWKSMVDDQCIKVGTPQITEVTEFSRVMSDKDGKQIYEIKAKYVAQNIAPWVEDPAMQTYVSQDQVKKLREPLTASYRLLRTDTGWELQKPEDDAPELTKETVLNLVAKWRGTGSTQACIRLPGRDAAPGFDVVLAPYAVTLYDMEGDFDSRFLSQLMWQSRFAQLVKAGIFREERVGANPKLNAPAGTRYVLDPAYQPWLDMDDARCLKMGQVAMDFVDVSVQQQPVREGFNQKAANATAKLIMRLTKDAWIDKIALHLPEVEAVKEAGGVPMTARLMWTDRDKGEEWRLTSLLAPQIEPVPPRAPRMNAPPYRNTSSSMGSAAPATSPVPGAVVAGSASADSVTWQSGGERVTGGRVSNQGLTVTYCCAGASSTTLASRGVASGKVYAEFTLTARPRALSGDTWTTIGVMPAPPIGRSGSFVYVPSDASTMAFGRGNEIGHNDVVGIAIDMDAGKVYFSRNGEWLNGQPGRGGGAPLARGQTYYIAAVLSASSSSAGTDSWTANFGKTKFRYAPPSGFKSYDGRQRR